MKAYVDQFHQENERSRQDVGLDFYIESNTLLKFNQTLQNSLKVSVGNDIYNLTKYDKKQITDTTVIKTGNSGMNALPYWKIMCNDKSDSGKISSFIKTTKTSSKTPDTGATNLPPMGDSFMYIETSGNKNRENVFVSFERIDIIQISNITFYYNRFSISTNDSLKSMGRFRVQLLLEKTLGVLNIPWRKIQIIVPALLIGNY